MIQIAEAWRQAQLAGAQGGTPEKEVLRIQAEQALKFQEQTAQNTQVIADKIAKPTVK